MIGLLLAAVSAASDGVVVEVAGRVAAVLLSGEHELYDPTVGPHVAQPVSIGLGGRVGLGLTGWLGLDGELHAYGGPTARGPAALLDVRGGPRFIARVHPRLALLAGFGAGGLARIAGERGADVDLAVHAGPGLQVGLCDTWSVRADWRLLATARRGRSGVPSVQHQLALGVVRRFGGRDAGSRVDSEAFLDDDGRPDASAALVVTVADRDGRPLPGAEVSVDGGPPSPTGADGRVTFPGLPPRSVVLSVASPLVRGLEREVRLVGGPNAVALPVHWRRGVLDVRVTDAAGRRASAEIEARSPHGSVETWTVTPDDAPHLLSPGMWLVTARRGPHTDDRNVQVGARSDLVVVELEVEPPPLVVELPQPVRFAAGSALLAGGSREALCDVAPTLRGAVRVDGFTDERGSASEDLELSRERADAVARVLARCGVGRTRLTVVGHGRQVPITEHVAPPGADPDRWVVVSVEPD